MCRFVLLFRKKIYLCKQETITIYKYEQTFDHAIFITYCCDIQRL